MCLRSSRGSRNPISNVFWSLFMEGKLLFWSYWSWQHNEWSRGGWRSEMHAKLKIPPSIFNSEAWICKRSRWWANFRLSLEVGPNPARRQSGGYGQWGVSNLHLTLVRSSTSQRSSSKQIWRKGLIDAKEAEKMNPRQRQQGLWIISVVSSWCLVALKSPDHS